MLVGTYIKRDVFWTKSKLLMNHSWESFNIYQVQIQGKMFKLRKIKRINFFNGQYFEEEEVRELEGHTSGSIPPMSHTIVNNIKDLKILWGNCRRGNILLTSSDFSFTSMTLPNILSMWFCGDISKYIPLYITLHCKDVKQVKGGKKKLSNMKTLVKYVMIVAVLGNRNYLVVT